MNVETLVKLLNEENKYTTPNSPVLVLFVDEQGSQFIAPVKHIGHYDDAVYIELYKRNLEPRG